MLLTSSPPAVRVGSQLPRISHTPLFTTSAGDDAVDLAHIAGLDLFDWQKEVLRRSLGEKGNGWAASEVGLIVPRQNGKGSVLEARELAGLYLFGESLIIHSAHLYATALEHFARITKLIRGTKDLAEHVVGYAGDPYGDMRGIKSGNVERGIELRNGNRLRILARSSGGGRGFSGDLVVLDEAYSLTHSEIAAMFPTMAAKSMLSSPQIWYASSAGMADSEVLASLRERGMNGVGDRLAYMEWSDDGDDREDPDGWYRANPSLGLLISEDFVRDELDAMRAEPKSFDRERRGVWDEIGGETVFPEWGECADPVVVEARESGDLVDQSFQHVTFAVDVPPDLSSAAVLACGARPDGSLFVEVVDRREGTDWVGESVRALQERQAAKGNRSGVYVLGFGAVQTLRDQFRAARVRPTIVGDREFAVGCVDFANLVAVGGVAHSSQPELNLAVDAAKRKFVGDDLWKLSRKNTVSDISPLVAAVLAVVGSKKRAPVGKSMKRRRGSVFT